MSVAVEEIREILAAHAAWIKGSPHGKRADFQDADLQDADLHGVDLDGANLRRANLQDADLQGTNLRDTDLRGTNLRGAKLRYAYLQGTNLRDTDLQGADLERGDLPFACLYGARAQRARLKGANLYGADLQRAYLYGADIRGAFLCGADIRGAFLACRPRRLKWRRLGLMPYHRGKGILVWKHVTSDLCGNLGFQYAIGEEYTCPSMACAGPYGAMRGHEPGDNGWIGDNPAPHVLAIWAKACYDCQPDRGIYYALRGLPVALYCAVEVDNGDWLFDLVKGEDVMPLIQPKKEGR